MKEDIKMYVIDGTEPEGEIDSIIDDIFTNLTESDDEINSSLEEDIMAGAEQEDVAMEQIEEVMSGGGGDMAMEEEIMSGGGEVAQDATIFKHKAIQPHLTKK